MGDPLQRAAPHPHRGNNREIEGVYLWPACTDAPEPREQNARRPERPKGRGPHTTLGMAGRRSDPEPTQRPKGARINRIG
eukprot:11222623-Lingulodinium_polyedra.AAC.1